MTEKQNLLIDNEAKAATGRARQIHEFTLREQLLWSLPRLLGILVPSPPSVPSSPPVKHLPTWPTACQMLLVKLVYQIKMRCLYVAHGFIVDMCQQLTLDAVWLSLLM